jgi:hypothetical protein
MIIALSTDERVLPSAIPDSVTVNVMNLSGLLTTVVVTADINGFAWRPVTPGTIPLSASAVSASLVAFPSIIPTRETSTAYRVQVELPAVFYGQDVQVVVDLFDNLNPLGSTAFVGGVALVPEPSAVALLGMGGLAAWSLLFRRRS